MFSKLSTFSKIIFICTSMTLILKNQASSIRISVVCTAVELNLNIIQYYSCKFSRHGAAGHGADIYVLEKKIQTEFFHFVWLLTTTAVQPDTAVYSCTCTARYSGTLGCKNGPERYIRVMIDQSTGKKNPRLRGFFFPVYRNAYLGGPRLKVPVVLLFGWESVSLLVNPCVSPGRYCCSSSAAARLPNRFFFGSGAISGEWSMPPRLQKCALSRFSQPFSRQKRLRGTEKELNYTIRLSGRFFWPTAANIRPLHAFQSSITKRMSSSCTQASFYGQY